VVGDDDGDTASGVEAEGGVDDGDDDDMASREAMEAPREAAA
jgi:hypothetical protein